MVDLAATEMRVRHDDDLDALASLAARVHELDGYPVHLPGGDFVRFLNRPKPMVAWVATDRSRILGHVALNETTSWPVMQLVAALGRDPSPVYIARLLVDPYSRRRGIGRALLDHARRAALDG